MLKSILFAGAGLALSLVTALPTGAAAQVAKEAQIVAGGGHGIAVEDQTFIKENAGRPACEFAEVKQICDYFGADTIQKITEYTHSRPSAQGRVDPAVLKMLEEGAKRTIQARMGERGLSDQQFNNVFPLKPVISNPNPAAKIGKIRWRNGFDCVNDTQSGLTGWWYPFNTSRLVTCAFSLDARWSWWIFSVEGGITGANSTFWRKETSLWIPEGAEPKICSTSTWNSNVNNILGPSCNSYDWISPVTAAGGVAVNQPPVAINDTGSTSRLGHNFNTLISF